jgi:hypothetical protein
MHATLWGTLILVAAALSVEARGAGPRDERCYELRIYTAPAGKLDALHARFRDHTCKLFAKHGMTNWAYWTLEKGQPGADETLVYLLAHRSKDSCEASFAAFREDPAWKQAKAASEAAAGGSLTTPDGVKSVLLVATDYSPTR